MPGTYPAATPTLSGVLLTIHNMLQSPTLIRRRLQTLGDLRFAADQILTGRYRSSGGAVISEQNQPLFTNRPVESVAPGAEYPFANLTEGVPSIQAVKKWGQAVELTDERIKRFVNGGDEVDRCFRLVINSVIKKVDALAMAAIASNVTATQAASAAWNTATPAILRDVENARAAVIDLDRGFMPDTILMKTTKYATLITDDKVNTLRRRETTDNPVYGGSVDTFAGLRVVTTSASNLPTDDVWLIDSNQLGGMADETEVDPGYTVAEQAVQIQNERVPRRDKWDLWGRRITVPVINEPGAAIRITGT